MSGAKNKNPAEDLIASLLEEVGEETSSAEELVHSEHETEGESPEGLFFDSKNNSNSSNEEYENTGKSSEYNIQLDTELESSGFNAIEISESDERIQLDDLFKNKKEDLNKFNSEQPEPVSSFDSLEMNRVENAVSDSEVTNPSNELESLFASSESNKNSFNQPVVSEDDKTVAVTGFQNLHSDNYEDKAKVSIGQSRSAHSTGYASWGGNSEASLGQAENLRIAQEKILELERENEKLRTQNEELISASEIIKERSDLLTAQINEFKNDKEGLEESFKNEVALLKGHLHRKEAELQKSQIKIDDLESRLKFDMKKIRIRERELENRLELIRAEKNAINKSKDEQILDLRRKMDILQMETESYRQKCVDLNKLLENNQDSFKRTTRALRLAMANLELQEENKSNVGVALKKVD